MNQTEKNLQAFLEIVQAKGDAQTQPETNRVDLIIKKDQLLACVTALEEAHWGYLAAITGLDNPPTEENAGAVEVLYHFCEGEAIGTLRVSVPYADPTIDSVCDLIPSATLYERELGEMFGLTVMNTPDPSRLLLADDWPADVPPLRKSFSGVLGEQPGATEEADLES